MQEWPNLDNNPTRGIELNYKQNPHQPQQPPDPIWQHHVQCNHIPTTPPRHNTQHIAYTIGWEDMMQIAGVEEG
eukprot:12430770-Karenia_brevis.AAC.1